MEGTRNIETITVLSPPARIVVRHNPERDLFDVVVDGEIGGWAKDLDVASDIARDIAARLGIDL